MASAGITQQGAGVSLTISMPGLESLSVSLSRLRTQISDWRPFWIERFAPAFYQAVLQDFVLEGGASGDRWDALSPAYAAWKQAHYPNSGILVRSGVLKTSLSGPDAPDAVFQASPDALNVGTSVPYALYHQLGTRYMPQRPPIRLTEAFARAMGKQMQQFVQEAWQKAKGDTAASGAVA